MTSKKKPAERHEQILNGAIEHAAAVGFGRMTRGGVAAACGLAPASINLHFSTMTQLRRDVMRAAVKREILPIVAQGLALKDPHACKAPAQLRERALASLLAEAVL